MLEVNRGDSNESMECPLLYGEENAGLLLDYCNRKLAAETAEPFERHLESCPACRAFAGSQMAVWSALDSFEAAPVSENFDERLFARMQREESAPWWSGWRNRLREATGGVWRPAIPVAAILLVIVGLWIHPFSASVPPKEGPVAKSGDRVDAEQVESALEDMEMIRELAVADIPASKHEM